jgi:L-serine dehydratase
MQSIASVYKIGHGPSSSHTMGPVFAVQAFKKAHPKIKHVKIILYGSLALTGKGHLTDAMMIEAFEPVKATVIFNHKLTQLPHPNTLDIMGLVHDKVITKMRVISIGGGEIQIVGKKDQGDINHSVYPISNLNEIISKCETKKIGLINYIKHYEPASTWKHLSKV